MGMKLDGLTEFQWLKVGGYESKWMIEKALVLMKLGLNLWFIFGKRKSLGFKWDISTRLSERKYQNVY